MLILMSRDAKRNPGFLIAIGTIIFIVLAVLFYIFSRQHLWKKLSSNVFVEEGLQRLQVKDQIRQKVLDLRKFKFDPDEDAADRLHQRDDDHLEVLVVRDHSQRAQRTQQPPTPVPLCSLHELPCNQLCDGTWRMLSRQQDTSCSAVGGPR